MTGETNRTGVDGNGDGFEQRSCVECLEIFELTAGQVDWYIQKFGGPEGLPKRCAACRAAKRAAREHGATRWQSHQDETRDYYGGFTSSGFENGRESLRDSWSVCRRDDWLFWR